MHKLLQNVYIFIFSFFVALKKCLPCQINRYSIGCIGDNIKFLFFQSRGHPDELI